MGEKLSAKEKWATWKAPESSGDSRLRGDLAKDIRTVGRETPEQVAHREMAELMKMKTEECAKAIRRLPEDQAGVAFGDLQYIIADAARLAVRISRGETIPDEEFGKMDKILRKYSLDPKAFDIVHLSELYKKSGGK